MNAKLTIDRSGRIVVPKRIRDELQLEAGSKLDAETSGDSTTLRPVRRKGRMVKERGFWVICTWNERHFDRLGTETTSKVKTPAELLRS